MSQSSKTVFVLGAGFSRFGGFPLQSELLRRFPTLELIDTSPKTLDIFSETLLQVNGLFRTLGSQGANPGLEDLFTFLDQCIARRESFLGLTWQELDAKREALKRALLFTIHHAATTIEARRASFYERLGAWLCWARVTATIKGDPFSVVSLNWDSLLEDSIYRYINTRNLRSKIDIDYCCYTTSLSDQSPHTPSILQKAKGIFNIKVLKLHGSANWLMCPSCSRVFTGVGAPLDVWTNYVEEQTCRYCAASSPSPVAPRLAPYFVTPTYVKAFDNAHIQSIWHNAYVELSEASHVVFIGYSLPVADYHVRTLLRRAVSPDTKVTVVLTKADRAASNTPKTLRFALAQSRFTEFFGDKGCKIRFTGVESYFGSAKLRPSSAVLTRQIKKIVN